MKTPSKLKLTIATFASLAMPALSQIDGPPALIDYQGRVLDSIGDPVAQGTTENIEMYFRIWDHIADSLGPNLVWAEKQIVTVADGNFSVRLGEGEPIESSAGDNVVDPGNDDPRPSLLDVFEADERFLGVSVAPNSSTKPQSEIQPRLAFLTTPFAAVAEKARFAEFGPLGGIFSADQIGVGTTSPMTSLHVANTASLNLLLEADTDDSGEGDQPTLTFSQDGGTQQSALGYFGGTDDFGIDMNGLSRLRIKAGSGDIGLGTSSPSGALHVLRGDSDTARILATGSSAGGGMFYAGQSTSHGGGFFYEGDATPAAPGNIDRTVFFRKSNGVDAEVFSYPHNSNNVSFTGRIGVGTESPSDSITVQSGDLRLRDGVVELPAGETKGVHWWYNGAFIPYASIYHNASNQLYIVNLSGGVRLNSQATGWSSNSDERLKSNIEPLTGILDKIDGIRVVGYNMAAVKHDPETGKMTVDRKRAARKTKRGKTIKHEIGTIAQDWMESFPELVSEPNGEDDYYSLAYDRIGVVAIGAAQELSLKLRDTEDRLEQRDAKIADLEARLAKLEALVRGSSDTPSAAK